jgi:hypothetical protein
MRAAIGFVAVVAALALATPAKAQQTVGFGGSSGPIINTPASTSSSVAPINTIQLYDHSIRLNDFIPNLHLPQSRPIFGRSVFPTEPDGSFGMNYLKAFGFQGKSPPHPRNPIIFSLFP